MDVQLGPLILQSDPKVRLNADQTREVQALAKATLAPVASGSAEVVGVIRYLRPEQLRYLQEHRTPWTSSPEEGGRGVVGRSLDLLTKRAAEGGGSLPSPDATPKDSYESSLSLEEIGVAPLRLEEQAELKLDAAQAAEFRKALEKLQEIDQAEIDFAHKVEVLLRPEQIAWLQKARSRMEMARRMVPLWRLRQAVTKPE